MGEERWCLAICHTNYQEIDLQGWPYKLCGESWCLAALIRITWKSTGSYKLCGESWCLAARHTNYQEIDLFRVGHTNCMEKVGV